MRICSTCGERNEDWMDICQRCGSSIVNAEVDDTYDSPNNNFEYNSSDSSEYDTDSSDEKHKIANLDLIIVLVILIIILVGLVIYAFFM